VGRPDRIDWFAIVSLPASGRSGPATRGLNVISKPRLSIGLPVYDGEDYLAQSLDSLLGQTYEDFELILSSNASTDGTDEICRAYAARDSRIRLFRQPTNIGAVPNHYFVFEQANGELFKWASGDDLYARDLLARCIELLDEHPEAVLAHSWTAAIDGAGTLIQAHKYPLATDSSSASERLRSMLFGGDDLPGAINADDFYGVIRSDVLRRVKFHDSYHHADQTFMAELALHGPFQQVPDWLYFRRHHPGRAHEAKRTIRDWCANLDPKRANGLRHPTIRLVVEYIWAHYDSVHRAPLTPKERRECYQVISRWLASRAYRRLPGRTAPVEASAINHIEGRVPVQAVVAGQTPSR
jgi:glycosyltransferase involved in cell wall biosynthesis